MASPFRDLTPAQRGLLIALTALAGVLLVGIVIAALGRSSPPSPVAADTTTSTEASPTTTVAESTTTEASTTTSTEDTTTTTTTEDTTTTTSLAFEVLVLRGDGLDLVDFGQPAEVVHSALTALLGPPDEDSGWIEAGSSPFGVCPGTVVRGVRWETLQVLFTDGETEWASDIPHFFSYVDSVFFEDATPLGFTTDREIGLGSTRAELEAAYGEEVEIFVDEVFGVLFRIDVPEPALLWGDLADEQVDAPITLVRGGQGCGE